MRGRVLTVLATAAALALFAGIGVAADWLHLFP